MLLIFGGITILGRTDLEKSLAKESFCQTTAIQNLSNFFRIFWLDDKKSVTSNTHIIEEHLADDAECKDFVWAVRGAIQSIRNQVFHFDKNERTKPLEAILKNILSIDCYEIGEGSTKKYADQKLLEYLLHKEIELLPQLVAEKIKSAGLLEYYTLEDVDKLFQQVTLFSKPLPFIPSFKNVFSWGVKYQFSGDYALDLQHYFRTNNEHNQETIAQKYEARRNALRFVYEYKFVPHFMKESELFINTVEAVKTANKKHAETTKNNGKINEQASAFGEVPAFKDYQKNTPELTPVKYLQLIQSALINEEAKKRAAGDLEATDTGNFQQFLWQVFLKGFDTYLSNNKEYYQFISKPENQLNSRYTKQEKADHINDLMLKLATKRKSIVNQEDKDAYTDHIAFWTFCKMLDAKQLNELGNQFSKMAQATEEMQPLLTVETQKHQEIIQLCLLSSDKIPTNWKALYANEKECLQALEPYTSFSVDSMKNFPNLYVQSDGNTPVVFATVELAKKYATENIFKKIITGQFKVTPEEITEWEGLNTSIQNKAEKRQALHDQWKNTQKNTNRKDEARKNGEAWAKENGETYLQLCKDIDEYNWLDNKIHLVHLKNLHDLLVEILGRFIGFTVTRERDSTFYNAILKHKDIDTEKNKNSDKDFYPEGLNLKKDDLKPKRNYIAHLNYLTRTANGTSILDMLLHLRSLLAYDRKLKNAVALSFTNLLKKHGILITFKPLHQTGHTFVIAHIQPAKITHFGGATFNKQLITTNKVHKEYVEMVRAMLEFTNGA